MGRGVVLRLRKGPAVVHLAFVHQIRQLRVCFAQDQRSVMWNIHLTQCLDDQCIAFSAAGRAAVQCFRLRPSHELGLPGLGPPHHRGPVFLCVHGSSSSTRGSSTTPLSVPSACTPWSFSDRATAARSFSTAVASFRPFIVPGSSAPLRRFSRCRAFSSRTCWASRVLRMSVARLRLSLGRFPLPHGSCWFLLSARRLRAMATAYHASCCRNSVCFFRAISYF